MQDLRRLCNALRNDREQASVTTVESLVDQWRQQMTDYCARVTVSDSVLQPLLVDEIRRAYESGVAIASKQRQFDLATALAQQLKHLGFVPTDATYQYLIRNVALELIEQAANPSVEQLASLVSERSWERDVLEIVRCEENPHHRKTRMERKLFQQQLIEGVEAQLNDYEQNVAQPQRSLLPFHQALRVYASNGVAFKDILQLMVQRSIPADLDTYLALLQGARWTSIPATVSQLMKSGLAFDLTANPTHDPEIAAKHSHAVHLIWTSAMKAVCNSFTDRFSDRTASVKARDVEELQKIYLFVEKQLKRAFPKFVFASVEEHEQVYALRAKAAATCGLEANTLQVLDQYVAMAPVAEALKKDVFLSALELFSWSQLDILDLSEDVVQARANSREVSRSQRVVELARLHKRMLNEARSSSAAAKAPVSQSEDGDADDERLEAAHGRVKAAGNDYKIRELARRLESARLLKSYQLIIQQRFERADATTDSVIEKLVDAGVADYDVDGDLDVSVKLMQQYMTCAKRYEPRLRHRRSDIAPQVMRRVFQQIKLISRKENVESLDRAQLDELFFLAIQTAVLFWRPEDAQRIVDQKKRLLGVKQLDAREYDLLIFSRVVQRDVQGAYALLQEMHNAGMAPSATALHRIVIGVMHEMVAKASEGEAGLDDQHEQQPQQEGDLHAEVDGLLRTSDTATIEEELLFGHELAFDDEDTSGSRALATGSGAPSTLADLATFLQDWYNLYGVKPAAKTVVPLFARLLLAKDTAETKRLLQILESMDGGLTPASTLWLDKRLAQVGRSIDDYRL